MPKIVSRHYYNEFDPHAAQWLRNLMEIGLIPFGEVDERSILDVTSNDLKGYTQCHFFAGIGGWAYAESGLSCLVDGVLFRLADGRTRKGTTRVQIIKGFGNAIVPQVAAQFVLAFLDTKQR